MRGKLPLAVLISLLTLAADQASKFIFNRCLEIGESVPVIKGVLHLSLVYNTGIAFGLFKNQTVFFIAVSILAIILIILNLILEGRGKRIHPADLWGFSLMLGGAAGNLFDRIRLGHVVDFIDLRVWPVFNLADSCITVGAIIILIRCIRSSVK
ncbi:MAG: signal peptidase II [Candidatus Omnitrophota bacterium]